MIDFQQLIRQLDNRQVARFATLLLVVLLIYSIYQKVEFFLGNTTTPGDLAVIKVTPLPSIAAWHLFGDYTAIRATLLPKTQLNLQLEGIFFSNNAQQSQVIIRVPGQPAKVYRIDQQIPGGAIIKEILAHGVVLRLADQLQWLPLKTLELQFAPLPEVNLPNTGL